MMNAFRQIALLSNKYATLEAPIRIKPVVIRKVVVPDQRVELLEQKLAQEKERRVQLEARLAEQETKNDARFAQLEEMVRLLSAQVQTQATVQVQLEARIVQVEPVVGYLEKFKEIDETEEPEIFDESADDEEPEIFDESVDDEEPEIEATQQEQPNVGYTLYEDEINDVDDDDDDPDLKEVRGVHLGEFYL